MYIYQKKMNQYYFILLTFYFYIFDRLNQHNQVFIYFFNSMIIIHFDLIMFAIWGLFFLS